MVLAASAAMILARDGGDGGGGDWADSDSEDSDDFELSNFDPELGPRGSESWRCVACGCANTPYIRYCSRCWEVRTKKATF